MTENELRQLVVDIAKKDSGAKQYSAKHKQIIKDFNSIPGMGNWMTTDYAWCAATVSVWGYRAGLVDIYYPSASCNTMISKYKEHGRWVENDAYKPTTGDLIMYNWDAAATGDDKGEADHVGLVVSVANGFITVIEGNRNNAVQNRTIPIDWRYIRGFCVPDFASKSVKKLSINEVAKEVIAGKWGTGAERKKRLTAAGYDYDKVQAKVNDMLSTKKSVDAVAKEVIAGKWGVGAVRKAKLKAAGYDYDKVQARVNELLKK